jgi:hypothetical protein
MITLRWLEATAIKIAPKWSTEIAALRMIRKKTNAIL